MPRTSPLIVSKHEKRFNKTFAKSQSQILNWAFPKISPFWGGSAQDLVNGDGPIGVWETARAC